MTYTVPRPVFEKLAESLKDRNAAEKFASSIEEAVHEIETAAKRETVEKTAMNKAEIKEDLTKVLVTRELFDERFMSMNQVMNERFENMNQVMNERFENVNERFKRTELYLKILVGLSLFGITLANPGFIEIIKNFSR